MSHKDASAKQTQDYRDHFNHFDAPVLQLVGWSDSPRGFQDRFVNPTKWFRACRRLHRRGPTIHASPLRILRRLDRRPDIALSRRNIPTHCRRIVAFRWAWPGYPPYRRGGRGSGLRFSAPVYRDICPQHIHSFWRENPLGFPDTCCARIHWPARVFNSGASRAAGSDETIFAPDEAVFACPRKRPETGSGQHQRDGQTMRFDHVRAPEPALSCVLQSPLARDAKAIFGRLAPRRSTPSRAAIT
jgi:hypothetical protein